MPTWLQQVETLLTKNIHDADNNPASPLIEESGTLSIDDKAAIRAHIAETSAHFLFNDFKLDSITVPDDELPNAMVRYKKFLANRNKKTDIPAPLYSGEYFDFVLHKNAARLALNPQEVIHLAWKLFYIALENIKLREGFITNEDINLFINDMILSYVVRIYFLWDEYINLLEGDAVPKDWNADYINNYNSNLDGRHQENFKLEPVFLTNEVPQKRLQFIKSKPVLIDDFVAQSPEALVLGFYWKQRNAELPFDATTLLKKASNLQFITSFFDFQKLFSPDSSTRAHSTQTIAPLLTQLYGTNGSIEDLPANLDLFKALPKDAYEVFDTEDFLKTIINQQLARLEHKKNNKGWKHKLKELMVQDRQDMFQQKINLLTDLHTLIKSGTLSLYSLYSLTEKYPRCFHIVWPGKSHTEQIFDRVQAYLLRTSPDISRLANVMLLRKQKPDLPVIQLFNNYIGQRINAADFRELSKVMSPHGSSCLK